MQIFAGTADFCRCVRCGWILHLFFLQDDFLLQHFDCVELVVRLVLGEQHLHEGLFVSGLFGKRTVAPQSPPSRRYLPHPSKKKKEKERKKKKPSGKGGDTEK